MNSVAAAAVVAMPNEKWGEVPCAFIELKQGARTRTLMDCVFGAESEWRDLRRLSALSF